LNDSSFNAKGLHNEGVITNIYRGGFVNIGFDRDDMNFMTLYSEYLRAYGRKCNAHLPANKVEIMTSRKPPSPTCEAWWIKTHAPARR
jgi:hypothetical protein